MSCRPLGPWLFGKLPALGDFVSRGLDHGLRDALDRWLSGELAAARARFAEDFADRYFAAPAWRFVDCDGAGAWSGGALCASVDAAGRMFPLLLAAPADDADAAAARATACHDALHTALGEGWSVERLHAGADQPGEPAPGWRAAAPAWALVGERGPPAVLPGRFPAGVIERMLEVAG